MKIVIATVKPWNTNNAISFQGKYKDQFETTIITSKDKLTYEKLEEINPEFIFFPHWSWIIPDDIVNRFTCIIFHPSDLPFGKGGSPLQNLIALGVENTKISAFRANGRIDDGDIYIKKDLNLNGSAEEIFIRISNLIFNDMIPEIIEKGPVPQKQTGDIVKFKRRNPEQSKLDPDSSLEKIFDYIRMLDAEGYPKAYINFGSFKLEFSRASLKSGKIIADVEIIDEGKMGIEGGYPQ